MGLLANKVSEARQMAWADVEASPAFAAFKQLDDTVVLLGGRSALPVFGGDAGKATVRAAAGTSSGASSAKGVAGRRITQGDVAEGVLRNSEVPLHIKDFLQKTIAAGAEINGGNPLANFRSTVSKDKRFKSVVFNGRYYWWLAATPVPSKFKEATDPDLLASVASVGANKEGGEAHATAT